MMPIRWVSLLACLLALQNVSAGFPRASQPRAVRTDAWRTKIAAAEKAAEQDREEEAETLYREVLDQSAELDDSGLLVARAVDGLADLCRRQERLAEARDLYLRSAGMWERLLGPRQPRLAVTLHNLGLVETARGDHAAAEAHLLRALAIWEESFGADSAQAENTRRAQRRVRQRIGEAPSATPDRSP